MNRRASRHAVTLGAAFVFSVGAFGTVVRAQADAQKSAAPTGRAPAAGQTSSGVGGQAPGEVTGDAAVDPNKVVLTVGDQKVTAGEIDALINDLPGAQQQLLRRAGKRMLADELIRIKLFAQEAQKRKLEENPKVRRQLDLTRDQILASAVAADVLRKNYEENKSKYAKIQARHILIRTPGSRAPVRPGQKELTEQEAKAKADDIRKQLAGGANFAELARKESDDTVSGAQGGDLNVFGQGEMVPEFDKVAFALKEGEISEPTKTPFGYHVIQVQNILSFEDVQQEIAAQSNPQIQKLVEDLRKNTNVQLDESYFGPAPAAPGGAGLPPGAPGGAGPGPGGNNPQPTPPPQPQGAPGGQK